MRSINIPIITTISQACSIRKKLQQIHWDLKPWLLLLKYLYSKETRQEVVSKNLRPEVVLLMYIGRMIAERNEREIISGIYSKGYQSSGGQGHGPITNWKVKAIWSHSYVEFQQFRYVSSICTWLQRFWFKHYTGIFENLLYMFEQKWLTDSLVN